MVNENTEVAGIKTEARTRLPATFDSLRELVRRTGEVGREHGLLLIKRAGTLLTDSNIGAGFQILIPKNIPLEADDKRVFFHTHPPSDDVGEVKLFPSFKAHSYAHILHDIGVSREQKPYGGMLNIATEAGITFCVGAQNMTQGEYEAARFLKAKGIQSTDMFTELHILSGAHPGLRVTDYRKYLETANRVLDANGVALFTITDKYRGIEYTFLSTSWENLEHQSLENIAYGDGVHGLVEKLGLTTSRLIAANLYEALNGIQAMKPIRDPWRTNVIVDKTAGRPGLRRIAENLKTGTHH